MQCEDRESSKKLPTALLITRIEKNDYADSSLF
jgi:hypothetical protein